MHPTEVDGYRGYPARETQFSTLHDFEMRADGLPVANKILSLQDRLHPARARIFTSLFFRRISKCSECRTENTTNEYSPDPTLQLSLVFANIQPVPYLSSLSKRHQATFISLRDGHLRSISSVHKTQIHYSRSQPKPEGLYSNYKRTKKFKNRETSWQVK